MTTLTMLCTDGSELATAALTAGLGLLAPADRTLVVTVVDPTDDSGLTAAPLMAVGPPVAEQIAGDLPGPPFELAQAFQRAIDSGARIEAIEIGTTRDLTDPLDLVEENFPYLR